MLLYAVISDQACVAFLCYIDKLKFQLKNYHNAIPSSPINLIDDASNQFIMKGQSKYTRLPVDKEQN